MTEDKIRSILMVDYTQTNTRYVNSGRMTFDEFVEFLKNPPEDNKEKTKYFGEYRDRDYECFLYISKDYIADTFGLKDQAIVDEIDCRESDNDTMQLIRHYRKNNIAFDIQPIIIECTESFLVPVIHIINKEFESGRCNVVAECIFDKEDKEKANKK